MGQTISGTVYDYGTKEPIVGASVYYDGTTIGVATNRDGQFEISYEKTLSAPIIISFIGYSAVNFDKNVLLQSKEVFLKTSDVLMDELVFQADNWSREKKLMIFKREFIGTSIGAENCKIQNEDDIQLVYNPSTKELLAYCKSPIIIINKHLGYTVEYNLVDFVVEFKYSLQGLRMVKQLYFSGTSYFLEMREKTKKKYLRSREEAFKGSKLEFMRALARGDLLENKFEIYIDGWQVNPNHYLTVENSDDKAKVIMSVEKFSVLYQRKNQSMLEINNEEKVFYIDNFGVHYPADRVLFSGDFGSQRIANMLPQNYNY